MKLSTSTHGAVDALAASPGGLELGYLTLLAGQAVQGAVEQAATDLDMSPGDLMALYVLEVHGGLPGGVLARLMRLQQPTITAAADRLEAATLISRTRDGADRRRVWLHPTEQGRSVVASAEVAVSAALREIFAPLPGQNIEDLTGLLGRLVQPWLSAIVVAPGQRA